MLENAGEITEWLPDWSRRLVDSGALYQRFVTAGPRPLENRYVTLIRLDNSTLSGSLRVNVCQDEREFLAKLARGLTRARPALIVLDFAFLEDSCDAVERANPQGGTVHLQAALAEAADSVPVVLAQDTKMVEGELVRVKPMPVAVGTSARLAYGVDLFNKDPRKVPLTWPVYASAEEAVKDDSRPSLEPSIALVAARLYRQSFPQGAERLKDMAGRAYHPFTSFLGEPDFAAVNAIELVCDPHPGQDWRKCGDREGTVSAQERVRAHVAVVGWSGSDMHHTVIGDLPGYMIHANYIEALLDEHTLTPIPFRWQAALSIFWFVLVEAPFWIYRPPSEKPLFYAPLLWLIVAILVYYFAVVNLGLYCALFAPGLILLLLQCSHYMFESRREKLAHADSRVTP